jgi:enterochelin esterase-like enzyme
MGIKKLTLLTLCATVAFTLYGCANKGGTKAKQGKIPLASSMLKNETLHSKVLKKDANINIYLPKGYSDAERYPVLYVLHGYSGSKDDWLPGLKLDKKADELIQNKKIKPLIIVSPQIDNSYGVNSSENPRVLGTPPNNSLNEGMYEDYIYKELVSYIDVNYSTLRSREGRYIGGLSMGGCAALHTAFLHSDVFSKAGGHSPALFLDEFPNNLGTWLYPDMETRKQRDPIYLAQERDLKSLKVYLDCGDRDSYKFYEGCEKLYKILQEKGVESEYHLNPGAHDGAYWESNAEKYLLFYAGIG